MYSVAESTGVARETVGGSAQDSGPSLDAPAIALLSVALVAVAFMIQGDIGINLSDEGQLWYVTTRTALGDVPLRDVRSYDPARYYWGAAWFKLIGPGIISLRISAAAVQIVGLVFGLLTLRRVVRSWWLLGILGMLLLAWMHPLYKAFESATVLALVWLAVRWLEAPTRRRYFAAGIGIGLAAFVRVDHGLYGAAAFLLLILFRARSDRKLSTRDLGVLAAGIGVGYAPMLVMLIAVPGFFGGLVEHFAYLVRVVSWNGTPNLAKPVPWPWLAGTVTGLERWHRLALGLLFVAVPTLYVLAAARLALSRDDGTPGRALVLAAGCVGIIYAHYTFARPDLEHLAQSVHPLVILVAGLLATAAPRWRAVSSTMVLLFVVTISSLTVGINSPAYAWATQPYVSTRVGDDTLRLHRGMAAFLDLVQRTAGAELAPGQRMLIVPHWPALYVILHQESPLWETYFIFPETEERQRRMIADLDRQNVAVVLLGDVFMDNRTDLHFSRTHPILYRHLVERYQTISVDGAPRWAQFLRRKPAVAVAR